MEPCTLCPFACGVVRPLHEGGPGQYGVCRCAMTPKAARAAPITGKSLASVGKILKKAAAVRSFFQAARFIASTVKTVKSARKTTAGK